MATDDAVPSEVEALRALLIEQQDALAARDAKIAAQEDLIRKLEHNVEVFRRIAFGSGSEKRGNRKLPEDEAPHRQQHLWLTELFAEAERTAEKTGSHGSITVTPSKPGRTPSKRRQKLPSHLPTVRTTYELSADRLACECGCQMEEFGEDVTSELIRVELTLVHEIARKKYGCKKCGGAARTAPGPDRVIEKGLLSPSFLAHVISERFGMHMPYHRMEQKYAGEGLDLSRSVLQRSTAKCAELLEPIYNQLCREILAQRVIHTDDTPVTIACGESGRPTKGRVWVYADHDHRIWYDFTSSRRQEGPERLLGSFTGFLQADAYKGYDQFFVPEGATEVACWAHARRKFVEAESKDPKLIAQALDRIGALYAVERSVKEVAAAEKREPTAAEFLAARQQHSKPQLEALRAWLEWAETQVLPKSPVAEAIRYALNQWRALVVYTDNGDLHIDNNLAERALRPFAIGRKNWLFFQTEGGGKTAAILASLLQTARAAGINPQDYFRDVLLRIGSETDVAKLTPHGWKQHFAQEVADHHEDILCRLRDHFAMAR
ncbi:MAG: IS66 family transposase [Planctomycetota bacterium]